MDSNTFMGMLIAALAVLVSIVFTILNYVSNRQARAKKEDSVTNELINKLNVNLQLLNASISQLNKDMTSISVRQNQLEKKVNVHDLWIHNDDIRLDNHERRLKKLDGEVGIKDMNCKAECNDEIEKYV